MKKLTVTFPDGTKGSRRTAHPYAFVIAKRLDKARPSHDIVKNRFDSTGCAEGLAVAAVFKAEYDALHKEIWKDNYTRRLSEAEVTANHRAWDKGFAPIYAREKAALEAHAAGCPKKCRGNGEIVTEISRKPEPTGWMPVSWHRTRALAEKALATSYTDWKTHGYDEVGIFPVDVS